MDQENKKMKITKTGLFKIFGASAGFICIIVFFTKLLTPTWLDWNTDNTVKGIYKEPENRIQVLFLGNSGVVNGISPITLYTNYGLCAYNLGTPGQPLLASYYWLKEVYRLHSKTLRTVVLDTSFVLTVDESFEDNEKALTHMRLSPVKVEAYRELAEVYGINPADYLFPLTAYHSRWSEISEDDFTGLDNRGNFFYTRGQNAVLSMAMDNLEPSQIEIPNYSITREQERSPKAYSAVLNTASGKYFTAIRDFCAEHDLDLVLIKIPLPNMQDLHHDAVQYLADINGIPFIDFNLSEIQEEIGLDFARDFQNVTHPNIYGAAKISNYIGSFLQETYETEDVRGNRNYDYLAGQAKEFGITEENAKLQLCETLEEYLDLINNDRYAVFIAVKGNAAGGMTTEIRDLLSGIGFEALAAIRDGQSYTGMKDRGAIIYDRSAEDDSDSIIAQGTIDIEGNFHTDKIYIRSADEGSFSMVHAKNTFAAASSGSQAGNKVSIGINGKEYAENKTGLNFVVYDHVSEQVIDSSSFDTSLPDRPRTDLSVPHAFRIRVLKEKLNGSRTFTDYIETALNTEQTTIFIAGNMFESTDILDPEDIAALESSGLEKIHRINDQPYAAVIHEKTVLQEKTETNRPFSLFGTDPILYLFSLDRETSSVNIGSQNWNADDDSILVVVLDAAENEVIHSKSFRQE